MIMNKVYELSGQMAQNKFDNSYFILKLKILDFFFCYNSKYACIYCNMYVYYMYAYILKKRFIETIIKFFFIILYNIKLKLYSKIFTRDKNDFFNSFFSIFEKQKKEESFFINM